MNFWTETMCEVGGFALGASVIIGIIYFQTYPEKLERIKKIFWRFYYKVFTDKINEMTWKEVFFPERDREC